MKDKIPEDFSIIKKGKLQFISCDAISKIPGFTQVFTTRSGGVSGKPYDSLNMGMHTDDDKKKVRANIRIVEKALGIKYSGAARQVHGDRVIVIKAAENEKCGIKEKDGYGLIEVNPGSKNAGGKLKALLDMDADALITNIPGTAVGVRTADCAGTIIIDPVNKVVAAVHSGWRGVANKIPVKAVKIMRGEFGSDPEDLIAAVSPAIGPCCYEIGPEVYRLKKKKVFSDIWTEKNGHIYMDLWHGVKNLLRAAGLKPQNIHICRLCTFDNPEILYSHRRDKGKTGRMMALGVYKTMETK
jgi:YfiH family protein